MNAFIQNSIGITPEEKQLSVSGQNWGEVDLNGNWAFLLVLDHTLFDFSFMHLVLLVNMNLVASPWGTIIL